jgi:hypothetical protein
VVTVLSSSLTFFYKFIFPLVWIAGFGAGTITILLVRPPNFPWVMFPIMWVLGSAFIYWLCGSLKKVTRDSEGLVISNFIREVSVPWRDIADASGSRMINPPHIKLSFSRDVGFGNSIIFMPKARFLWPFQEHPVAEELRDLIRENRG